VKRAFITNNGPFDFIVPGDQVEDALTLTFQAWGDRDSTKTCLVILNGDDELANRLLSLDDMRDLHDAIGRHIDARVRRSA